MRETPDRDQPRRRACASTATSIPRSEAPGPPCCPISTITGRSRWSAAPSTVSISTAIPRTCRCPAAPIGGPQEGQARQRASTMVQRGAFDQLWRQPRDLQRALRRAGGVRSLHGGRLLQGDQRLDRGRMAGARCTAARLDRGADAGAGSGGGGDRAAAPAISASSPSWCWRRARACSGGGSYWPVWQAAENHKLPLAIHAGSQYRMAPSSIGWPSYRYEYYLAEAQALQAQILSLIYEGVFGKFPGLKVVLMESGVSWLPAFMWRANKTWRGVRVEVPWVDRRAGRRSCATMSASPCSRSTARRMRPASPTMIEQIGSDKMFLFSSRLSALAVRRRRSDARRICRRAWCRGCAPTIRWKPFRG